jgi:hypothetical protein
LSPFICRTRPPIKPVAKIAWINARQCAHLPDRMFRYLDRQRLRAPVEKVQEEFR